MKQFTHVAVLIARRLTRPLLDLILPELSPLDTEVRLR